MTKKIKINNNNNNNKGGKNNPFSHARQKP
jgi:hypothetical protein